MAAEYRRPLACCYSGVDGAKWTEEKSSRVRANLFSGTRKREEKSTFVFFILSNADDESEK